MAKRSTTGPRRRSEKHRAEPRARGLRPGQTVSASPPAAVVQLAEAVERDGGAVIGTYREPLGGHWQIVAALPIEQVAPTPYQRDLSEAHVARLTQVLQKMGRFLDPIVAVRHEARTYWTPNGHHRLAAMSRLGAKAVVALVVPDEGVAYQILALNTEKAHNLREKALEVVRMARALAELDPRPERAFALQFEEAAYLTLGLCYENRPRFSGGAYHPILRRVDAFLSASLPRALEKRQERAARLLELDDRVVEIVRELKERGLDSPYAKAFVVARINPIRGQRGARPAFEETLEAMLQRARRLRTDRIDLSKLARLGGPPPDEA